MNIVEPNLLSLWDAIIAIACGQIAMLRLYMGWYGLLRTNLGIEIAKG